MRQALAALFALFLACACAYEAAAAGPEASEEANPIFGYTHLLPSPFTLRSGAVIIGTEAAVGITDFLQVGTSVVNDLYRVFNGNLKLRLIDERAIAASLSLGFSTYNYQDIDPANPDLRVTSWTPGAIVGVALSPLFAAFIGGNFDLSSPAPVTEGVVTSGFVHGARAELDLSWAYNPRVQRSSEGLVTRIGDVISAGGDYDFTYKLWGVGASYHWRVIHVGLHFYPEARQYPIVPIITGSTTLEL